MGLRAGRTRAACITCRGVAGRSLFLPGTRVLEGPDGVSRAEERRDRSHARSRTGPSRRRPSTTTSPAGAPATSRCQEKGHLVVHPHGQPGPTIDMMDVVEDIQERKLGFPCVVRFQDVLRARVKQINEAFAKAIVEMGYGGQYRGVYPIKVNQMREVVEEILDAGAPYHYGLEAGSKGELLIVARHEHRPRGDHRLQRLQGRGLPPPRADRAQDRPQGHRRHREALGAARTSSALAEEMARRADDRAPLEAHHEGHRQVGVVVGRLREVRPHGPGAHPGGAHPEGEPGRSTARSSSTSTSAASSPRSAS